MENADASCAKAVDVAAFVVNWFGRKPEESDLTHMKMQKLLYYAQGHHLALYSKPLFNDEIQAWEHGPVVRSVYNEYVQAGKKIISKPLAGDSSAVSERQKSFIREVLMVRGQYSAWRLRDMTHKEDPWVDAYVENLKMPISQESMQEFFSKFVKQS